MMRTHYLGELTEKNLDEAVVLCGFVHRKRDHGGVIFLDLRDRHGVAQVVVDPADKKMFTTAEKLHNEYVVRVGGKIVRRDKTLINPNLPSGKIEIRAENLEVLAPAKPLPFQIGAENTSEELRLKYRYLDLRDNAAQKRLRQRADAVRLIRDFMNRHDFLDVETPFLTKATPEGARDYLIPARTHPRKFFALPQSPQLFKQLLMAAGIERYYQIVRCFRDEDLRADRQPEFTQLDVEMAFADEHDVMAMMEAMMRMLFEKIIDVKLAAKFPMITYADALENYGSDRPDLRIPITIIRIDDLVLDVPFKVFSAPAKADGARVSMLKLPGGAKLSRKQIDDYTDFVARFGAKGLAYIKIEKSGANAPILKFLPENVIAAIIKRAKAETGDIIFFAADNDKIVHETLGNLREKLAADRELFASAWSPVWVVDFPLFENGENGERTAVHHPFSAPKTDLKTLLEKPETALSRAYDLVINGVEVGGGSIRIHDSATQKAIFKLLGMDNSEIDDKFGFFVRALEYGCPPHGGIAFGLDRLMMLMLGAPSIRDVIAFPKTQSAACPLTDAPSSVEKSQLDELNIEVCEDKEKNEK